MRTAEEHAAGHLEGAQLYDWNSGEFANSVPDFDKDAQYLLYCRSGNRAGQAKELLEREGFSNVTNLGSLEEASAKTGIPIVK